MIGRKRPASRPSDARVSWPTLAEAPTASRRRRPDHPPPTNTAGDEVGGSPRVAGRPAIATYPLADDRRLPSRELVEDLRAMRRWRDRSSGSVARIGAPLQVNSRRPGQPTPDAPRGTLRKQGSVTRGIGAAGRAEERDTQSPAGDPPAVDAVQACIGGAATPGSEGADGRPWPADVRPAARAGSRPSKALTPRARGVLRTVRGRVRTVAVRVHTLRRPTRRTKEVHG